MKQPIRSRQAGHSPSRRALVVTSLALIPIGMATQARAATRGGGEIHASVDAYARACFQGSEVQHLSTDEGSPSLHRVFGIALGQEGRGRQALIFVLERVPGSGGLRELARSKPFDFSDASGRTDFEIIEAQSERRFSLQINARSACGVHVTIYRFAQHEKGTWVLAGMDTREPRCGENGDLELAATSSTNFLTGRRVDQAYRNDRPTRSSSRQLSFPSFPLAEFEPFDSRHHP